MNAPLSTATGIGARLAKKKLVKREQHPKDKRMITLRLTEAGRDLATRAQAQVDSVFLRVQEALSPEEFHQLIELVQKIFTALQAQPPGQRVAAERSEVRRIKIDE